MKADNKKAQLSQGIHLRIKRRVFTLAFKAEVVRHKKAENLSFADCGCKFDVLPKLRLTAQAMRQSMSGTGNCYDSAPMESFWHSLKVEETHGRDFATRAESLDYRSPAQFERECHAKLIDAANDDLSNQDNNNLSARLIKRAA